MLFEREDESDVCPFGGGVCGVGPDCPLHHKLVNVQHTISDVLHHTTFEVFNVAAKEQAASSTAARSGGRRRRESYRASKGTQR